MTDSIAERFEWGLIPAGPVPFRGATIVRVHDVAPTFDALKVWQAVERHG